MRKKEILGYVKLEWTCPNCKTRNPGPRKTCSGCGAVQPADVQFEQMQQEQLITDQKEVEKAQAGADIICPYCQARNPAGTAACLGCGGDLSQGKQRESGQVLGALRDKPAPEIACPSCGTMNPVNTMRCTKCGSPMSKPKEIVEEQKQGCSQKTMIIVGVVMLALFIFMIVMFTRTTALTGQVQSVAWSRAIPILAQRDVSEADWRNQIPSGARIGNCEERAYGMTDNEPSSGRYDTICGTPYTVDTGSGFGEVRQDCQYQVYAEYCQYTTLKWVEVDRATLQGADLSPKWPVVSLSAGQQEGQRMEAYQVTFSADGKNYKYAVPDYNTFLQFEPGSTWTLEVNSFDAVVSVSK